MLVIIFKNHLHRGMSVEGKVALSYVVKRKFPCPFKSQLFLSHSITYICQDFIGQWIRIFCSTNMFGAKSLKRVTNHFLRINWICGLTLWIPTSFYLKKGCHFVWLPKLMFISSVSNSCFSSYHTRQCLTHLAKCEFLFEYRGVLGYQI